MFSLPAFLVLGKDAFDEGRAGRIDLRGLDGVFKVLLSLTGGDIEIELSTRVVNAMI